mmetsp:Transcript_71466/g.220967  ORF Transcript_71466/g.220967 Transcript_71466/m.220967 type:complete len:237 (+) Transcript_71466:465-1175(+)
MPISWDCTSSAALSSLGRRPSSTALSSGSTCGWISQQSASWTLCRWTPSRRWHLRAIPLRSCLPSVGATRTGCKRWLWRTTSARPPSSSLGVVRLRAARPRSRPGISGGSHQAARLTSAGTRPWGPRTRSGTRAEPRATRPSPSTRGARGSCAAPARRPGCAWTSPRNRRGRRARARPCASWRRRWAWPRRTCSTWAAAPPPRPTGCWRWRPRPSRDLPRTWAPSAGSSRWIAGSS